MTVPKDSLGEGLPPFEGTFNTLLAFCGLVVGEGQRSLQPELRPYLPAVLLALAEALTDGPELEKALRVRLRVRLDEFEERWRVNDREAGH